jgi:hypothetical protein
MLLNFSCFVPIFLIQSDFFMPYNAWVLMIDPLNYASVDPSLNVFGGSLAKQGIN